MTPSKLPFNFGIKSYYVIISIYLHYVLLYAVPTSTAYIVDSNPYHHFVTLDPNGKYELEWLVNWEERRIRFNVTVQTTGYVGFGLSSSSGSSKMRGADIVLGGVSSSGRPYFSDRHAVANQLPIEDPSQDWELHNAWERGNRTFLSFSRPFDTCDKDHDLPITDDFLSVIWAYGEKDDEIEYHHQNRGSFDVYLLDPDLTPREVLSKHRPSLSNNVVGDWKVWTIRGQQLMPSRETTYICTVHKAPGGRKKHIVGFNSILPNEVDRRHIHHFLLHRCIVPPDMDAASLFQRHVGRQGEQCYILNMPIGRIPTQYCREVVHVWEVNGNPIFYPEHVGIPLSESTNEYYMLQMHYDNPDMVSGVTINYALEIFYTENLRQHDLGVLTIGELTPASPSILVPPGSLAHVTYGHCGSGCTSKILPRDGIHVVAANLHTHLAGRGVRLVHVRNNQELPWLSYDNNYNFNFQQIRILREERTILPGDLLINRCVYSNTDRNGNVTVGGFSSRMEMCNGFLWYYNKLENQGICRSEIRSDVYRRFVGIWNTTWSNERIENIVTTPVLNAGLAVSEVGNTRIDWTIEKRNQLQYLHRYIPQITQCPPLTSEDDAGGGFQNPSQSQYTKRFGSLRRNNINANRNSNAPVLDLESSSVQGEITDPEYEFVTVYPKDIVPYELPSVCRNSRKVKV